MLRDDRLRLICPACQGRFLLRPDPGETHVRCPNPACGGWVDVASQADEEDEDSLWLSWKFWPWVAGIVLAIVLGMFRGC